jgi:UDP-3-O-[3-hydroxymyristoyl] glucosamine N-acyltransferase
MNPLYKKYLETTSASAVILLAADAKLCPVNALISPDPYYTYAKVAMYFDDKPIAKNMIHQTAVIGQHCEIHPLASIGPNCVISDHVKIGANTVIGANSVIGDYSEIGENCYFHPNVTLYHKIIIGHRVLIGSGTVIGSDGFGFAKYKGVWHKVPQLGRVVIEDDVEIGANSAIDRGAIEDTIIQRGVKLDNHIQIGHNVRIGENTAMAAFVGVSGSTEIGSNCLIGGQTGFAGHISVTDNVVVTGGSGVTSSIREPGIYSSGMPGVVTNREWRKNNARIHRLDKLVNRVKELELTLNEIKERK